MRRDTRLGAVIQEVFELMSLQWLGSPGLRSAFPRVLRCRGRVACSTTATVTLARLTAAARRGRGGGRPNSRQLNTRLPAPPPRVRPAEQILPCRLVATNFNPTHA